MIHKYIVYFIFPWSLSVPLFLGMTGLAGPNVSSCLLQWWSCASMVLIVRRTKNWMIPEAGLVLYWYCNQIHCFLKHLKINFIKMKCINSAPTNQCRQLDTWHVVLSIRCKRRSYASAITPLIIMVLGPITYCRTCIHTYGIKGHTKESKPRNEIICHLDLHLARDWHFPIDRILWFDLDLWPQVKIWHQK